MPSFTTFYQSMAGQFVNTVTFHWSEKYIVYISSQHPCLSLRHSRSLKSGFWDYIKSCCFQVVAQQSIFVADFYYWSRWFLATLSDRNFQTHCLEVGLARLTLSSRPHPIVFIWCPFALTKLKNFFFLLSLSLSFSRSFYPSFSTHSGFYSYHPLVYEGPSPQYTRHTSCFLV